MGRTTTRPRPRAKMPFLGRTLDRGPTKTKALQTLGEEKVLSQRNQL